MCHGREMKILPETCFVTGFLDMYPVNFGITWMVLIVG